MTPIEEIKQKIDIVDLINGYVPLTKSGRNYKGLCPFHSEDTPSFMVSQELQIFKCFGCNQAGDIFAFIGKIEGVEFPEALKRLAEKAGVELEEKFIDKDKEKKRAIYDINELTAKFYAFLLTNHPAGKKGLTYLKENRRLTDETIKSFRLGYAPDTWDTLVQFLRRKGFDDKDIVASGVGIPKRSGQGLIDKFRGRIAYPLIAPDGKVVGFTARTIFNREPKYINTNETLVFHKNNYVYGLDKAKVALKKDGAVFVEGQMDVIGAHQAGFTNVVASSGTALNKNQLNLIGRYTKDLIFCFDSDTAGVMAVHRSIRIAEELGFNIKVALIPGKHKDIDELVREDPALGREMFASAIPAFDFYMVSALKRNDKQDSIGKKKIMEELVPIFCTITNKVTLDHYVKKLSEALNLTDEVVYSAIARQGVKASAGTEYAGGDADLEIHPNQRHTAEQYLLALILRISFDKQGEFLYKLSTNDFTEKPAEIIFSLLKKNAEGKTKHIFDIQRFIDIIPQHSEDLKSLTEELYLFDFGDISETEESLLKELNVAFAKVKQLTTKRELKKLTERIKLAEMEKNQKLLDELLNKHKELSQALL